MKLNAQKSLDEMKQTNYDKNQKSVSVLDISEDLVFWKM